LAGGGGGQAFDARARQVVAQWTRSPTARVWRTGLVLLSRPLGTRVILDAGTGFPVVPGNA